MKLYRKYYPDMRPRTERFYDGSVKVINNEVEVTRKSWIEDLVANRGYREVIEPLEAASPEAEQSEEEVVTEPKRPRGRPRIER